MSNSLRPMEYIVHGILQARILEWVAFPFSKGSSQPRDWTQVSHIKIGPNNALQGKPHILIFLGDFPDGPLAKTPCAQSRGL